MTYKRQKGSCNILNERGMPQCSGRTTTTLGFGTVEVGHCMSVAGAIDLGQVNMFFLPALGARGISRGLEEFRG